MFEFLFGELFFGTTAYWIAAVVTAAMMPINDWMVRTIQSKGHWPQMGQHYSVKERCIIAALSMAMIMTPVINAVFAALFLFRFCTLLGRLTMESVQIKIK